MSKARHRLIIDTNLWISLLLTKDCSRFDDILFNNATVLELVDEFVEVAQRPKFRKYFPLDDLQALLQQLYVKADFVQVTSTTDACRDPKDNFLLALAADGNATHLITGDKDLLDIKKFGKTHSYYD